MSTADQKKAARARFEGVYDVLRDELIAHFQRENLPVEAQEWFRKVRN